MTAFPSVGCTRRGLLLGLGAAATSALTASCSSDTSMGLAAQSIGSAFAGGGAAYPRTRAEVDASPYSQLGMRFGSSGRGILALYEKKGDELLWVSADRVLLVTRKGRIVRTQGLPTDVGQTRLIGPDMLDVYTPESPRLDGLQLTLSVESSSTIEGLRNVYSRFTVEGPETIDILGTPTETLRVRENMSCKTWDWDVSNYYWLSRRSPLIWRSRQYLLPGLPMVETELLKRPG